MNASHDVIIIGSGPAGLTAALYTARANLRPLVIEGIEAGGQLMLTTMVENWPGHRDGVMGPDLMREMREQAERFGAQMIQAEVSAVRLTERPFLVQAENTEYSARALIVATGASARWLDLGVDRQLSGRGVSTCATCDGYFFKGRDVAIVGGGDTAMEEAIYLSKLASTVRVIHRRESLRASKVMQDKAFATPNISFIWNTEVIDIKDPARGEVTGLVLRDLKTDALAEQAIDGLFIAIGHTPNTMLFKGQLELDEDGYVRTHHGPRTNIPGVFAAGDVQDRTYRQAITASGSGCMAAIDAERYLSGIADDSPEEAAATLEQRVFGLAAPSQV